jgi:hypothetical protein
MVRETATKLGLKLSVAKTFSKSDSVSQASRHAALATIVRIAGAERLVRTVWEKRALDDPAVSHLGFNPASALQAIKLYGRWQTARLSLCDNWQRHLREALALLGEGGGEGGHLLTPTALLLRLPSGACSSFDFRIGQVVHGLHVFLLFLRFIH